MCHRRIGKRSLADTSSGGAIDDPARPASMSATAPADYRSAPSQVRIRRGCPELRDAAR